MSPTIRLMCSVLCACLLSISSVGVMAAIQQSGLSYEQLMQRSVAQRRDRVAAMTAEEKAVLQQTHAERWLDVHRASLSQRQIDLVIEAIAFLSADRNRQDTEGRKYGDELKRRLTCELGRAKVTAAFTFLDPPRQSWINLADEWLAWFPECVLSGAH